MKYNLFLKNTFSVIVSLIRYNLKIIFANKFIYFLLAALVIFVLLTLNTLFSANANPTEGSVFWLLLFPGLLLIFYPITFGIQNDVDNRMIEILFGIPDYRYKVWLVRLVLIFSVAVLILLILSIVSSLTWITIPIFEMVFQLMFPVVLFGCIAFMVSTIVRNGSGTAVVMVIFGMTFLIGRSFFNKYRKFDIFLNPFELPRNMNEMVWADLIVTNRIYLFAGIILALLFGLLNLQKREKFL